MDSPFNISSLCHSSEIEPAADDIRSELVEDEDEEVTFITLVIFVIHIFICIYYSSVFSVFYLILFNLNIFILFTHHLVYTVALLYSVSYDVLLEKPETLCQNWSYGAFDIQRLWTCCKCI